MLEFREYDAHRDRWKRLIFIEKNGKQDSRLNQIFRSSTSSSVTFTPVSFFSP